MREALWSIRERGRFMSVLRSTVASPMVKRNPRISMGTIPGREYERAQVLEESVRSLCDAVGGDEFLGTLSFGVPGKRDTRAR